MKQLRGWMAAALSLAVLAPMMAVAQDAATTDFVVPVHLDLYDGDRMTKTFSDALKDKLTTDPRFHIADPLPAEGVNVIMNEAVKPNGGEEPIASYEVKLKLGSGKFLKTLTGFCNQRQLVMCSHVVAEDIYTTYGDWKAKQK